MYYASFGLLSIVIHFIINADTLHRSPDGEEKPVSRRYRFFLWSIVLYYVVDVLWGSLYDLRIIPLVYADTVMYFFSMVLSLLMWTRFIAAFIDKKDNFIRALTVTGWAIFLLQVLILILNFFIPVMFSYSADKEYLPGKGRYVILAVQVLLFALTALYTFINALWASGRDRRHYNATGLSGAMMTVFIILQTLFPLLPFYAIGCLLGTCIMHSFVVADEKEDSAIELGFAKRIAYIDPLTRVKNRMAYIDTIEQLDRQIKDGSIDQLGIVVLDVNDLKKINDSMGHEAGDQHLKEACNLICDNFRHSPVFRIGGDEFTVILQGDDYRDRLTLMDLFDMRMEKNRLAGLVVVAGALDIYDPDSDSCFDEIFKRADEKMYERKKNLKEAATSGKRIV